jgi:hypothetical protein
VTAAHPATARIGFDGENGNDRNDERDDADAPFQPDQQSERPRSIRPLAHHNAFRSRLWD